MSQIRSIAELGDDILRKRALEIDDISEDLKTLISDMITTVKAVNGLGIAAPQVYESKRVFIMASKPSVRYPNAPKMEPIAIINPVIIEYSGAVTKDWEGCLSIPGIRGYVPRYESVKTQFITLDGQKHVQQFDGFIARIFQHEFDHLEGIVFLNRLESNEAIITEKVYQRLITQNT